MSEHPTCDCLRARHEHGTRRMYTVHHCHCLHCRIANSHAQHSYRRGGRWTDGQMVPAIGIRRRLEALHTLGWSAVQLGERLGMTKQAVRGLCRPTAELAMRSTHATIAALYDKLWDQTPTGTRVNATRAWARARGFVPPLAWDDDEIDNPGAQPYLPDDGVRELAPCGTASAARRHARRGEHVDEACRRAARQARAQSRSVVRERSRAA